MITTAAVLVLWFFLALVGSLLGVFGSSRFHPPLLLGVAVVLPPVVFLSWYRKSGDFRRFIASLDLRKVTMAQTGRSLGVIFLILQARGVLPGVFALPAGWGDIAVGVTAPVIVSVVLSRTPFPKRTFVVWNVLGILDLVMAVSLGVLVSPTPVGLLAGAITTQPMAEFPLSLIPTFLVPLFLILHLIALRHVRQKGDLS